ncbi:MAG: CidA/LrgA family protein [Hyphomicrobiaceae bacterium]
MKVSQNLPSSLWLAFLFLLPIVCEKAAMAAGISLPGAVAGFFILLVVLVWQGEPAADLVALAFGLIRWLPVAIVAPMVGILGGSGLGAGAWLAVAVGVMAGLVTTLLVTGLVMRALLVDDPAPAPEAGRQDRAAAKTPTASIAGARAASNMAREPVRS